MVQGGVVQQGSTTRYTPPSPLCYRARYTPPSPLCYRARVSNVPLLSVRGCQMCRFYQSAGVKVAVSAPVADVKVAVSAPVAGVEESQICCSAGVEESQICCSAGVGKVAFLHRSRCRKGGTSAPVAGVAKEPNLLLRGCGKRAKSATPRA